MSLNERGKGRKAFGLVREPAQRKPDFTQVPHVHECGVRVSPCFRSDICPLLAIGTMRDDEGIRDDPETRGSTPRGGEWRRWLLRLWNALRQESSCGDEARSRAARLYEAILASNIHWKRRCSGLERDRSQRASCEALSRDLLDDGLDELLR
ncbi:hypothetical protein C8F04DRAFT_1182628 [Mycena alexandri]|uniref:Uncharacterized protein n=1 Tax=Mycena alexandri TaxID=1745969 RepID=A0AAD6SWA5_9AGAR|nr:hypothetical protein C8F04DRAFT_1182628 [Mycena alexandri]